MKSDSVKLIPLGGVGEFGANATILQTPQTSILIDFGLMFPPDQRQPGVEYYVIDPDQLLLDFPDLSAVFVTHGHEDHIGGLPFLLEKKDLPVYTMPYTAGLIRHRMDKNGLKAHLIEVKLNEPVQHFDIEVEFIGVTHSIVQATALLLRSHGVSIVHSGDFKVDALPGDDYPFQSERLRTLGEEGVDLLIVDSTNANKSGFCPSDYDIVETLEEQIQKAPGRVFFTTFSSHIPRLRKLKGIAERTGRKIALLGRSFVRHYVNSLDTRYLSHAQDTFISVEESRKFRDSELIYVVTGSQGERNSALSRIVKERFQSVQMKASDTVILSSKAIPGNERIVALLISEMENRGVKVISGNEFHVHTSGHGYREDSAYMLSLVRPKCVIPIHGEFSHLLSHFNWLKRMITADQSVMLMQNGDIMRISPSGVKLSGQMESRMLPIDGNQDLPIPQSVLRERKDMMYSGTVIISANTGRKPSDNHLEVRTFGMVEINPGFVANALRRALIGLLRDPHCDGDMILRRAKQWLKGEFFGRPLVQILFNGQFIDGENGHGLSD
ncbi:MAG: ribonuclease J [Acidobacteria bacterium]|nr:ribonuclease J [Acidobacteriota bacterium]